MIYALVCSVQYPCNGVPAGFGFYAIQKFSLLIFLNRFSLYVPCKSDAGPEPQSFVNFQISERAERVSGLVHAFSCSLWYKKRLLQLHRMNGHH